jgi:MinD superfamily P-loop ATPase
VLKKDHCTIAVASGKGGTGKTTVATNLFLCLPDAQLVDCDVEEPNAHLFVRATDVCEQDACVNVPSADPALCTGCKKCQSVCAFNALAVIGTRVMVFNELCHSCGACAYFCPSGAITEVPKKIGTVHTASVGARAFVYGTLSIGEVMAPPLIRQVKERIDKTRDVIIDSPPGTSCSMITALKAADFCLMVTEPTPFGLHDLKIACSVIKDLGIACGVVINRDGVGSGLIEDFCAASDIPILARIRFDRAIAESYSRGVPIVEALPEYRQMFEDLLTTIKRRVGVEI